MTKKKEKRKKEGYGKLHSLRSQIAVLFIGLLLLSVFMITVINALFLERYYVAQKADVMTEASEKMADLVVDIESSYGVYEDNSEAISDDLRKWCSRNNLTWIIITDDNEVVTYLGKYETLSMMRNRLFGYAYDLDNIKQENRILRETGEYVIQQVHDRFSDTDYVESWGEIQDDSYYFLIRTPLESIRESASISNDFYFFVGLCIILFSGFIIWIVTKRITKPLSELTKLSRRMSELNFDVTYQSHAGNEIDVLGDNFNRMSQQLEQTISELKSANNKLQKDIADKIKIDKMRKEFLDNVSHELKTPIALIQGYAEGLKENISEDPESREFYCDVIMDEAGKMNKLVKNLLTLNQLESGKDETVMERFDIISLIKGVLQTMDIMVQQKGAKVIFDETEPIYVWADEFKTEEVVTNYTSNALNHLEGERTVEIKIIPQGDRIRISVFNTGQPIPEEDIPNLWNKFYKVDKARTREYGGSGIGLSIVKAIMEDMNQEYGVQNYDNGVEFWFTLDTK